MSDFKIPYSNNNVELAQIGIDIKQKISKFRSKAGAENYCNSKNFILTIKKRKLFIIDSVK